VAATEHLELARSAIAAYNGDDLPALLDLISEDVVATVPVQMANAGVYHGHDGFLRMLEEWGEAWEDFRIEAGEPFAAGDAVVIPVRQFGRGRGSGIETDMSTWHVAHFHNQRLVRWRLCETREEALAHALGEPT
jgi:ketosteroid isomerase-like protein